MGRLFWKFFAFVFLAQVITILGVGTAIEFKHRLQDEGLDRPERLQRTHPMDRLGRAEDLLRYGGSAALQAWLQAQGRFAPLALNAEGHDALGRSLAPEDLAQAQQQAASGSRRAWARQVSAPDGRTWLLIAPTERTPLSGPPDGPGRPGGHGHRFMPWEPFVGGILASLISAFILARYIAKPIRNLRLAFASAATGDLKVRVDDGKRSDELADLGRDFDRMAAQLGALMVGQRRLLHDVSHELRSPLARLQAAIGLARQQPDRAEASMQRIERESVRMDKLVGELLTLSRLEAGVTGDMSEAVDMGELVGGIMDDAGFEAESTGRRLVYHDCGSALVRGRPELLHRSVENVVRNALRYTADGSEVTASAGFDAGRYRLTVRDQGPGVAEGDLNAIFEPFFRCPTNPNPNGHGLGLAIAKRVIQTHGGTIQAQNRAEGGLEVIIDLPAEVA